MTALPQAPRPTWKQLLAREQPLLLPVAHDALSARLIERAGFAAYGIGGFALVGARHALPDVGLAGFGEISAGVRDIVAASALPVLVDCDDGYGDAKNVARTVQAYEAMGVAAIFIEDQAAPKRCGHMTGKKWSEPAAMEAKIRAAAAARRRPRHLHHRPHRRARGARPRRGAARAPSSTCAPAPTACSSRRRRASRSWRSVGRAFAGVPQLANMVEGGGHTPILPPAELKRLGFAMVAYPTTLLFGVTHTIEQALADLKAGRPANSNAGVDFDTFKDIVGLARWAEVEERAGDAGAGAPPAAKTRAARTLIIRPPRMRDGAVLSRRQFRFDPEAVADPG